jgi:hypothetical protein
MAVQKDDGGPTTGMADPQGCLADVDMIEGEVANEVESHSPGRSRVPGNESAQQ